ncbi:DUF262 domain-containing protein [Asanoa sp. NPDC050611]|uniref:GmrSD restriction endonuclease domain-containing protein n=1 Tax=Asanoa sp. NPDC050611 TaxID=3157098 RepID=UPI0033DE6776
MKAQETTFEQLVSGAKQFRVPLYQRPYSWTPKEWAPLWRSICEQADAIADNDQGPGHFLGSVVLAPAPGFSSGSQAWIVVDGQQRLTTMSLLLCALRDRARIQDARHAQYIHEDFLINRREQGDGELKVLPTQLDRAEFRACVRGEPLAGGAGNIGEAYRFFQEKLEEYDDPEDPYDLNRIEKAITRRLEIVEISAGRDDNAHRIFESLNNTGRSLDQADLLRNYLFMLLPTRGDAVYEQLWLPMQERLGSSGLELLGWLDLVLRGQASVRRDDVYRAQQSRLRALESNRDEAGIEKEIAELARRAALLDVIQRPKQEHHPDVRAGLRRLAAWDATTTYPVLLSALDRRDQGTASHEEVVEVIAILESFLVRRMVCGVATNNLNRVLNGAPAEIATGPIADKLRAYLSKERHYWADDDTLRKAIRERNFYWAGRGPQRQFVLRRLEESFDHKEPVDWLRAKLTIEHVMPQTLSQTWRRDLEELVPAGQSIKDAHTALVHGLGNLTLSGYNGELGNKPFAQKRTQLRDSGLAMNHRIADSEAWGPAQILARADDLATRAIKLWPGPIARPAEPPVEGPKWRMLRQALAALPAGTWTSYSHLAELIGSSQVAVGRYLGSNAVRNGWRVLRADGSIAAGFKWAEPGRKDDPRDVLTAEGVTFIDGKADPKQQMWPIELADALGMDTDVAPVPVASDEDAEAAFWDALTADEPADEAAPELRKVLATWQEHGGELRYATGDEVHVYLCWDAGRAVAPWVIYPGSYYGEVLFNQLKKWPPFDRPELREEFRQRCNKIDGMTMPAAKIDFVPWFSLDLIEEAGAAEAACDALTWFLHLVSEGNDDAQLPSGVVPRSRSESSLMAVETVHGGLG